MRFTRCDSDASRSCLNRSEPREDAAVVVKEWGEPLLDWYLGFYR